MVFFHPDGKTIELVEVGKRGSAAQKFTGKFLAYDPDNMYGENNKLNCEVIVGKWYDPNANRAYSFYLSPVHGASMKLSAYSTSNLSFGLKPPFNPPPWRCILKVVLSEITRFMVIFFPCCNIISIFHHIPLSLPLLKR